MKLKLLGTKRNNRHFSMFLQVVKKSTDTLTIEKQRLIFEKGRLVVQEKSEHSQPLATSVCKVCDAMTFSWNVIIERFSADGSWFIEIMTAETEVV